MKKYLNRYARLMGGLTHANERDLVVETKVLVEEAHRAPLIESAHDDGGSIRYPGLYSLPCHKVEERYGQIVVMANKRELVNGRRLPMPVEDADVKDELQKEAEEMNELGIRKLPRDDDGTDPDKAGVLD